MRLFFLFPFSPFLDTGDGGETRSFSLIGITRAGALTEAYSRKINYRNGRVAAESIPSLNSRPSRYLLRAISKLPADRRRECPKGGGKRDEKLGRIARRST